METKKDNRNRWLHLRLNQQEYDTITAYFKGSTCRKLSDYSRLQLLKKPIIGKYRNESLDSLMMELLLLRSELNAIGNNLNQSVKKLHSFTGGPQFQEWAVGFSTDSLRMLSKMEEIKKSIAKIGSLWLQ